MGREILAEACLTPRLSGLGVSPTVAMNELCDELRSRGRTIAKLGLGQSPFAVPAPVVAALEANAWRKDYLAVKGLRALRDAVADYHRRRHGVACSGDDVLIGPGSKELMFLLQVVYRGDLVIPTPAWVSYAPQARIIGREVHLVPTDAASGWRLLPEQLEALCRDTPHRPRVLILNYPSNPTGGTYTAQQIEALGEVARAHGIIVLSDEIYGELHFEGRHASIARSYPEGTIISSGLSKWCGAGGWRLGTFTFPAKLRWLLDAMAIVASESFTTTSAPIQYAAVRAFEGGQEIEDYLRRARQILAALAQAATRTLRAAGVQVEPAAGSFYLFPDFAPLAGALRARGVETSDALCARLLTDAGVALLPGSAFGRPPQELTARIALVDFDGARAMAGLAAARDGEPLGDDFLRTYCFTVMDAIERLCAWARPGAAPDPRSA
ncbi:aminotransferase [Sorangium cellulosum]|uniref:Aminotransferase n=1 Tax=Sorangium cellulosum TaxID=56 RepID=A0A4P2Q1D2_SORCE|nr:aminotransferase class I/II-fold pyridoxal phosphate-dependent enzyme [Sorangium cellulosum]AUX22881.1 aminotransferase [Sorangium cellulosum]